MSRTRKSPKKRQDGKMKLVGFLRPYPVEVQRLFLDGRELLLGALRPVVELHYDATSAVCAGFSFTGGLAGAFVNLAAYSDHVTLVFPWGVRLADPQGRLKGEGKQVRHMRLADLETLRDPYVMRLIAEAATNAPRPESDVEPGILVKIYAGPKRRPVPSRRTRATPQRSRRS